MATLKQGKDGAAVLADSKQHSPTMRWLRNHKEIARFLKLKASQKFLRTIGEWIARADFPAKQKKGFVGEEVRAWYLRFAAEQAKADAPLIAARQIIENKRIPGRRALQSLEDGNIQHSTFNAEHSSGEGDGSRGRSPHQGNAGNHGPIPSQAAMAVELQVRYGLPIKRQTIHNWINGVHLPTGAPRFPINDPGRAGWNNPLPCYEWYEKWIVVPTRNAFAGDSIQGNLFEQKKGAAIMAEFEEQIESAAIEKLKREALERENNAKWILRELATGTATRAMNDLMHIVETEFERNAPQRRRERLAGLLAKIGEGRSEMSGTPGAAPANSDLQTAISEFSAWDAQDERERMDRIRAACARAGAVGETSNIQH